ncbi:MAG: alpha/beta hydrolase, partial [Chloroflexi bacterium]|nr:alpha/beta hydrolase [Chloroflexota bacterium]
HAVEGGYETLHDPNAAIHWQPSDLWDEVKSIERPLLFIRGGRSTILDAQTLQDMDMAIPGARSITLEKAGHSTYWDMEPEWNAVATAFLEAHGA